MSVTLSHYLIVAGLLFCVGLYGALARRNAVVILMSIELMLNAVNLNLVAFSRYLTPQAITGQVWAVFIMTIAAAEAAVGLGIVLAIYRQRKTVVAEDVDLMKW